MRYFWIFIAFFAVHSITFSEPRITIIGSGLAGLTAAYRLQKLGHISEVYEARERPGGRVLTAYFGTAHEELGGKNIYDGGSGEHMVALLEELGLGTVTQMIAFSATSVFEGKIHFKADVFKNAPEPTEEAFQALKAKIDHVKSLADLLDLFLAGNPVLRHRMEISMCSWEASPTSVLPPEYLYESFWRLYKSTYERKEDKPLYGTMRTVAGGNSRLVQVLADALEGHIHYGKPLRKISKGPDQKIRLHFDDECTWTDYLILALPCSTLRDVDIEEGLLPEDQLLAIQTLQYGTSGKIVFPIKRQQTTEPDWFQSENGWFFFNKDHTTLTWLGGGQPGIFTIEDTVSFIEKEITPIPQIFPDLTFTNGITPSAQKAFLFSQYDTPVAVSWANEEFSKGSYSNFGLGTFAFFNEFIEEHGESVRKVFRSVDDRIFFAGEHTAPQGDNGTMDGAINSGERAARLLDKSLSLSAIQIDIETK